jgi:hypothetical protein
VSAEPVYLYGFVAGETPAPPSSLRGIAGRAVTLEHVGDVQAVVSRVPSDVFDASRIEERLHDLEWVGEQGALHERVVTWFVDHGGVLPVRLLTLYTGPEALRAALAGQGAALRERLAALRDLREWDLKVSFDARSLGEHLGEVSEEIADLEKELAGAAPGRRYLLERKRDARVAEETSRAARRLALELHDRLSAFASDARRLPLPNVKAELPVVLNAAYLVARPREEDLARAAAEARDRMGRLGVQAQLTGPWAPYRFLGEDESRESEEPGARG